MHRINRLLQTLINFLLPRSSDSELVRGATDASVATLVHTHTYHDITSLLPYRNELVRALIWQLKYKRDERAAQLLGAALTSHVLRYVPYDTLIIPIPLSPQRWRERGYNQVTLVVDAALAQGAGGVLREDILVRRGGRERQTRLGKEARTQNITGVFNVTDPHQVIGRDVVLIDDVTTTGSTLGEAQKTLMHAGASHVTCIALAH